MCTEQQHAIVDTAFRDYGDAVFRFVMRRVTDREVALDVTQETFARLWVALFRGTAIGDLRSYLFTIAANQVKNHYRSMHPKVSLDALIETGLEFTDDTQDASRVASEERLNSIVASLGSTDARIVSLRYFQGMTVTEIGKAIGMSRVRVSVRLHRALKRLKPLMES